MPKHIIYLHRNIRNGKIYIGQTNMTIDRRSKKDGKGYYGQKKMREAIEKYGWDAFEHAILEQGLTQEQADEREIYWIRFFHSNEEAYGYNKLSGGRNWSKKESIYSKEVYCIETGQKFNSLADAAEWCGLKRTSAHNITQQINGERCYVGRHPETGEELHWCFSLDDVKKPFKEKTLTNCSPVINLMTQEIYSSISNASKASGISAASLSKACMSRASKPVYKDKEITYWAYLEDYENNNLNYVGNYTPQLGGPIKVINVDTGKIFNSMKEAAKWCGLSSAGRISYCCQGKVSSAGKHPETKSPLHWAFFN